MNKANKARKYRVVDNSLTNYGKIIKARENNCGSELVDIKTGVSYQHSQLEQIEHHAVYGGITLGRFGLFLFAREYLKYRTIQFGLGIDYISATDKMLDIELKFLFFGIGIRFIKIANLE